MDEQDRAVYARLTDAVLQLHQAVTVVARGLEQFTAVVASLTGEVAQLEQRLGSAKEAP
jgi:hypothetical protein